MDRPGRVTLEVCARRRCSAAVSRLGRRRGSGAGAACAAPGVDPVVAVVFTTDSWTPWDVDAAEICLGCPVRAACTVYAAAAATSGIWGGWRRSDRLPVPVRFRDVRVAVGWQPTVTVELVGE